MIIYLRVHRHQQSRLFCFFFFLAFLSFVFLHSTLLFSRLLVCPFASPSPRSSRRASHATLPLPTVQDGNEEPDETTALLRSGTFGRRRRRRSTGFPGFTARPSPRGSKRKSSGSQGALGGFWKMSWWKKGDPPDPGPGGGDGSQGSNII